ncbi:MAG: c-type cytochrome [Betaproteobacteria bacterium]|nr:c-type cytochrome [Betaproteobacteria bacterium]MDE2309518.1 c-type cytochrome [Betaproteobacteria bacterium]
MPAAKAVEPVLSEAEGRALAQKSNCFACHSIEKKVVGPAWKDIAAKYRGDAGAEDRLIAKVSRGSSGVWGSVPMPPNSPAVKDADIKALVKFTLSLK